MKISTKYNIVN